MQNFVKIRLPEPHSHIQEQIMMAFRTPGVEEVWVACGTKFGKTVAGCTAFILDGASKQQQLCRWVAPIYKQAKNIGMANVRRLLPGPPITQEKKSDNAIYIPTMDTTFEFWHGQDPESLEGAAGHLYVFDEAAKMKEGVYASARTTVTQTRSNGSGKFLGISTPLGRNWFYKKCMEAQAEMERAAYEKRPPKQVFLTAPTAKNPYIDKSVIDQARMTLPKRLYEQYYLAAFLDDAAVFSGYKAIIKGDPIEFDGSFQLWLHPKAKQCDVVIGVDWARNVDYTVFTAIAKIDDKIETVGFCRFHGKSYVEAIKNLILFTRKFNDHECIYHDKTGVGIAIDDQLAQTDLITQGITFTNASKAEMVTKLITAIEQRTFSIPNISVITHELDVYEMTTNPLGNMVFKATEGEHDDCVSSLMLAHAAMLQYFETDSDVKILEELVDLDDPVKSYYDELIDDDLEESGFTRRIQ